LRIGMESDQGRDRHWRGTTGSSFNHRFACT